ncbi:P-loop containing nucleoside triphosphate hydrolase protein [Gautieria morchelliformis]|nr:P-loop containing nucleoside triphosphate hydrolase protein [Gautieria morchelliformis]
MSSWMNLPPWRAKLEFLQAFKTNRVVVCVGEMRCGKTTQVPQYILDDYLATPPAPDAPSLSQLQIIVTQPRRVAALSMASRVSAERGDDSSVGYTIRGESNASRRTMLLFCTTGVVLRRLTVGNGLEGVRVVVVAEVNMGRRRPLLALFPQLRYGLVRPSGTKRWIKNAGAGTWGVRVWLLSMGLNVGEKF